MNSSTNSATAPARPRAADAAGNRARLAFLIIAALVCGQFAVAPQLASVLGTGAFPDTDDAMRMVEVRNLIHGAPWFDLTEWRLDPPFGMFSHWSRLIDAPLVLFVKSFELFFAPETAERLARVAWPLALTCALYLAAIGLCRALLGKGREAFALLAIFLTVPFELQFQPGRIDHHSVQIILLTVMVWTAIASLTRPRLAAASATAFAVSLAISLENLPFAPIVCLPALAWIMHGGARDRSRLLWFALGAALATPALLAATVGFDRWLLPVKDAFSGAHAAALVLGAICYGALAGLTPRLSNPRSRLVAALCVFALAALAIAIFLPSLLHSPFADVDPLVRAGWLDQVTEVQPIQMAIRRDPLTAVATITPLLLGLFGALRALRAASGLERLAWIALAAPLAIGVASLFVMVRIAYSTGPLAVPGLVYLGLQAQGWAARRTGLAGDFAAFLLFILAVSAPGVTALCKPFLANAGNTAGAVASTPTQDCYAPDAIRALDALPPGVVFGDIDLGPDILAYTRHSVVGGPYHRNTHGNRLVLEAKRAEPDAMRAIIRESKADYVLFCRGELDGWKTGAPRLSALVSEGAIDDLRPIAVGTAAFEVFATGKAAR